MMYNNYSKKNTCNESGSKPDNLLMDDKTFYKPRGTFYPTSQDSLINRTQISADIDTYYNKSTKIASKNTSCNQTTTTDVSVDIKPLSQRKSLISDKISKVFEIKHANTEKQEIDIVSKFYQNKAKTDLGSTQTNFKLLNLSSDDRINLDQTQGPSTNQPPLPKNFKRVPAMMENLARKEQLLQKANEFTRGRSESSNRIGIMAESTTLNPRVSSSDRPGSVKDYKIGRQIGKGAYAVVKLVTDRYTNEILAMKVYEKYKLTDPARRKSVAREIAIMK